MHKKIIIIDIRNIFIEKIMTTQSDLTEKICLENSDPLLASSTPRKCKKGVR